MQTKILQLILALFLGLNALSQTSKTIYDFKVKDIDGNDFTFRSLQGKKILIVNTASKCGFTPQYADLEKLYQEYKDRNLVIVGFPSNDFMGQEPGSNDEIKNFCQVNYGVSFLMMSKISVKGKDQHPLYQWLTQKAKNGVLDSEVAWNFQKYLIDEEGHLVDMLRPRENPYSEKIIRWLQ
jgi:glutathione peroxidase